MLVYLSLFSLLADLLAEFLFIIVSFSQELEPITAQRMVWPDPWEEGLAPSLLTVCTGIMLGQAH